MGAVDAAKLRAVDELFRPLRKNVRASDESICLPPRASFPALFLAQADAFASADQARLDAFKAQFTRFSKTIPMSNRLSELPSLRAQAVQFGELAERRRFRSALARIDEARQIEEKRILAAKTPKVCFTMSCKDYAMDLGANRKLWEDSIASGPAKDLF